MVPFMPKWLWMFFLVPITVRHIKKKSLFHLVTVERYLFLDSRFTYLISAREEHRRYLILKLYEYWLSCPRITNASNSRFNLTRYIFQLWRLQIFLRLKKMFCTVILFVIIEKTPLQINVYICYIHNRVVYIHPLHTFTNK